MRIAPISYNYANQNSNKQSFKANIDKESFSKFAAFLRKNLEFGETDSFFDNVSELAGKIQGISIKGKQVVIGLDKLERLKHSINFTVKAALANGKPGEGASDVKLSTWFGLPSGKKVAKRFLPAAQDAADEILENLDYLKYRAQETAELVNNRY